MKRLIKAIEIIFLILSVPLAVLNLFFTLHTDYTDYEGRMIAPRGIGTIILAVLCAVILAYLVHILEKKNSDRKVVFAFLAILVIAVWAIGLIWIVLYPFSPKSDQQACWDMARNIAEGIHEVPDTYVPYYYEKNPQQHGTIWLFSCMIRLLGDKPRRSIMLFNVASAGLNVLGMWIFSYLLFRKKSIALLSSLLMATFLPMIVYCSYVYSTVMSYSAILWGFIAFVGLQRELENRKRKAVLGLLILLIGVFISFACLYYTGAMISLAAILCVAVFYILNGIIHHSMRAHIPYWILVCGCVCILFASGTTLLDRWFINKTGVVSDGGIPITALIYTSITVEETSNGPGGYSGAVEGFYAEHDHSHDLTDTAAREEIIRTLSEYARGERSWSFFVDKTLWQWNDPWFTAAHATVPLDEESIESDSLFGKLIYGKIPPVIELALQAELVLVWLCAILGAAYITLKDRKMESNILIILVYVIGGILFQLMDETKGRYCMPYYLMLMPLASYGLAVLGNWMDERLYGRVKRKNR